MGTATSVSILETLPKPTIWAEPGSVVTQGRPVSIWCQGSKEANRYYLHRDQVPQPWRKKFLQRPRDKVKFHNLLMTQDLAGRYHCRYRSQASRSVLSEPLHLVVTGEQMLSWAQPTRLRDHSFHSKVLLTVRG